jgi:hypothetical protein
LVTHLQRARQDHPEAFDGAGNVRVPVALLAELEVVADDVASLIDWA